MTIYLSSFNNKNGFMNVSGEYHIDSSSIFSSSIIKELKKTKSESEIFNFIQEQLLDLYKKGILYFEPKKMLSGKENDLVLSMNELTHFILINHPKILHNTVVLSDQRNNSYTSSILISVFDAINNKDSIKIASPETKKFIVESFLKDFSENTIEKYKIDLKKAIILKDFSKFETEFFKFFENENSKDRTNNYLLCESGENTYDTFKNIFLKEVDINFKDILFSDDFKLYCEESYDLNNESYFYEDILESIDEYILDNGDKYFSFDGVSYSSIEETSLAIIIKNKKHQKYKNYFIEKNDIINIPLIENQPTLFDFL